MKTTSKHYQMIIQHIPVNQLKYFENIVNKSECDILQIEYVNTIDDSIVSEKKPNKHNFFEIRLTIYSQNKNKIEFFRFLFGRIAMLERCLQL